MSSSISRRASCARDVPALQTFDTPLHETAFPAGGGLPSYATQHPRRLWHPIEDPLLNDTQDPVRSEAEHADQGNAEENQRGIEGIPREHDYLAETKTDTGRLGHEHDHPRAKHVEP